MSDKDKNPQMLTMPFGAEENPRRVDAQHHCDGCNEKGQLWGAALVGALTRYHGPKHLDLVGRVTNAVNDAIKEATAPFVPELIAAAREQGNTKLPFGVILLATHDAQVQLVNQLCGDHHPLSRAAAMSGIHRALLLQTIDGTSVYHHERALAAGFEPKVDLGDAQDSVDSLIRNPIDSAAIIKALETCSANPEDDAGPGDGFDLGAAMEAIANALPEDPEDLDADTMQSILDKSKALAARVSPGGVISAELAQHMAYGQSIVDAKRAEEAATAALTAGKPVSDGLQALIAALERKLELEPGKTPHIQLGKIDGPDKGKPKAHGVKVLEFDTMPSEDDLADIIYGQIKEEHPQATITRDNILTAIRNGHVIKQ